MPRLRVQARATTSASADQAWAVVRDFCAPWHPLVATMAPEAGGAIRRFTVQGEDTVYRERLTWFSDSERAMAYTHLDGIQGARSYDARLVVVPTPEGAVITMSAELSAPAGRAEEIAAGTQAVFDLGTQAVAQLAVEAQVSQGQSAPPPVETEEIALDGLPRLALTSAGPPSDTLVLFLHGIGGNRSNWALQLPIAAQHARAAALDLRGYGGSTLGPEPTEVDDYCADILRVLQALGAKRLILCGLSYGAWIATSFALRHPEVLAGLVVSGGCTGMSEAGPDEREAFRLSREVPMSAGQTPADFAPAVVQVIAGPAASDGVLSTLHHSMAQIPAATYGDALRCFTNPLETFDFSRLNAPVLLMTGEHDRLAPPAEIKAVSERMFDAAPVPDVRFEVISGAGHVCNLERPEAYNPPLAEFLARVAP